MFGEEVPRIKQQFDNTVFWFRARYCSEGGSLEVHSGAAEKSFGRTPRRLQFGRCGSILQCYPLARLWRFCSKRPCSIFRTEGAHKSMAKIEDCTFFSFQLFPKALTSDMRRTKELIWSQGEMTVTRILITGMTGTIGGEIARQLCKHEANRFGFWSAMGPEVRRQVRVSKFPLAISRRLIA